MPPHKRLVAAAAILIIHVTCFFSRLLLGEGLAERASSFIQS